MILHFKTEEHKWLSNMYYCIVPLDNNIFPSAEHAYLYFKSDNHEWKELCKDGSNNPKSLKKFFKKESNKIKPVENWKSKRLQIMEKIVDAKYSQEPLMSKLIATGNENIQEGNWWDDTFWGVDLKQTPNVGENHLGRLIMKTRDKLNNNTL